MGKKKLDLDTINTERAETTQAAGNVFKSIETGASTKGQQGTASPQEIKERQDNLQTQGRKGAKAVRINMAFTPDNHEFLKVMARISGKTITEFCNYVIASYRWEHGEQYEQARAIIDKL